MDRESDILMTDVILRVRSDPASTVARPLDDVEVRDIAEAEVWREFRWHKNQRHYPGSYWAATMQEFVGYESRLELSCLLLEDFDPAVKWIRSQPFLLEATSGVKIRRHVPDYLLEYDDRTVCVVDVKPRALLARAQISEALNWAGRHFEARGWRYRVESEPDPVVLKNVRFVAGYRRRAQFRTEDLDAAYAVVDDMTTLGRAINAVDQVCDGLDYARAVVLQLLWSNRLRWDLTVPLGRGTLLEKW